MNFIKFIDENLISLIPALYIIGMFLKGCKKIPDFVIPFIITFLGIIFCCFILGFSPNAVLQGIFTSATATLFNQYKKQGKEGIKKIIDKFYIDFDDE
jgi:ABC-type multidrug transport system permease subunit